MSSIDLKKIKEAIKQAEANINFEETTAKQQNLDSNKQKTLKKGVSNDKRPLG